MPARMLHFDAFSARPGMSNPAGVVLDADGLSDAAMQAIARAVGFNETAFVLPSTAADLRLRYFTPRHEVDLCGHATVGSFVALHQHGRLPGTGFPRGAHYGDRRRAAAGHGGAGPGGRAGGDHGPGARALRGVPGCPGPAGARARPRAGRSARRSVHQGRCASPLLVEQGQEIGRDGRVRVWVEWRDGRYHARVGRTGCFVRELAIEVAHA